MRAKRPHLIIKCNQCGNCSNCSQYSVVHWCRSMHPIYVWPGNVGIEQDTQKEECRDQQEKQRTVSRLAIKTSHHKNHPCSGRSRQSPGNQKAIWGWVQRICPSNGKSQQKIVKQELSINLTHTLFFKIIHIFNLKKQHKK